MNHLVVFLHLFVPPLFYYMVRFPSHEHFMFEFLKLQLQRDSTYRRPFNWHTSFLLLGVRVSYLSRWVAYSLQRGRCLVWAKLTAQVLSLMALNISIL